MSGINDETAVPSPHPTRAQKNRITRLVAVFKFVKATLLTAIGLGAFELVHPAVADRAQHWVASFAMSYNGPLVQQIIEFITDEHPHRLQALGIAAFFFAILFTIEGIGLWRDRPWAEYLTVISTLSLVPFELYELVRKTTPTRFAALVINIAVVAYLIGRLYHRRKDDKHEPHQK